MNKLIRFIVFLCIAPVLAEALAAAQKESDSLIFRNGDFLNGKLEAIEGQSTVRWKHPDGPPMDFNFDSISQIDFPSQTNAATPSEDACRLTLVDGDSLEGNLVSYDHSGLVLHTWYAGDLKIPREALLSLVFLPRMPALVDGIQGLDGWTEAKSAAAGITETGHWIYRNGAFYADKAASIARDVKLPDVAEIQFDLNWKGGLNLAVALYTDSLQPILLTAKEQGPNFGGFYSLRFQYSAFIDLWPIKKMEPLRPLGQLYIPSLNTSDRLHVDLRISKPQSKVALLLDGKLAKEWIDPQGFAGEGTGVRFVQNPPGIIKLSNLRISKWDGNFDEMTETNEDTKQDSFSPENSARVAGTIESIADGKLTASTAKGPMEYPLAAINSIDFARRGGAPGRPRDGVVRATFARGGSLDFTLESWRPDEMVVHSPDFGKAKFNPSAFTRLKFVAPDKKPSDEPKS